MKQELFFSTAIERYRIKLRKDIGHQPYWKPGGGPFDKSYTEDPIFSEFRFCNVFREDDKVTQWFRTNVRERLGSNHLLQLQAAVVFRWFNNIATGEALLPFLLGETARLSWARERVKAMAANGERILNPAYMIKSPPGLDKATGLFLCISDVFDQAEMLTSAILDGQRLYKAHDLLCKFGYLGPFMAYQMVCDLRFTPLLQEAKDVNHWTAPGPGSARGIGRIFHDNPGCYNYNSAKDQEVLLEHMRYLLELSRDRWPAKWPAWELSTVQHWCCEYDKYMRVKLGEGTPKQRYRPAS